MNIFGRTIQQERSRSVKHILGMAKHLRGEDSWEFGPAAVVIDAGGYKHKATIRRFEVGKRVCVDAATGDLHLVLAAGSTAKIDSYCPTYTYAD